MNTKNKLSSKKWHKVLGIGIAALISMAMLTGCNNGNNSSDGNLYAPDKKETPQPTETTATQTSSANTEAWRQFIKDYENWTNSYIELAKKCKENPDDLSLISDYAKIMSETAEWANKAKKYEDELKNDNVSSEVLTEYINTLARITQKIAEVAE